MNKELTPSEPVVVRFAPSPTGDVHIGHLRTALYNFLLARKTGGKFILRIEDTDRKRFVDKSEQVLLDGLAWVDIDFDEGPIRQSERLPIYHEHAQKLITSQNAYYCFCSQETLDAVRKEQEEKGLPPRYPRTCRYLSQTEIAERLATGIPYVIRMKVPETGSTTFNDHIRGAITISNDTIEDQILVKSDKFPTYHLAAIIDDHLMGITHVIRTDEWLPSAPKHILLYQFFEWNIPILMHLPPIQNVDKRKKLSKREGATSVLLFKNEGYLPDAVINYIALLGWHAGDDVEIMSREEMIQKFDISRFQKAGAAYNQDKLDWFNQQYILKFTQAEFEQTLDTFLQTSSKVETELPSLRTLSGDRLTRFQKLALLERMRGVTLFEIASQAHELLEVKEYDRIILKWKKSTLEEAGPKLEHMKVFIEKISEELFNQPQNVALSNIEKLSKDEIALHGWGTGDVLWPLRAALSGKEQSPSPFELLWALGKDESLKRIDLAIHKLSQI